jgi:ABC-2 type transport system ATP-binding protein
LARQKLSELGQARKVVVLEENNSGVLVRIYPKQSSGELAGNVATLAQTEKWTLQELHTEEGRLDEVFRNITMPDTLPATTQAPAQPEPELIKS